MLRKKSSYTLILLSSILSPAIAAANSALPALNLENTITVSGLSSGGYMANQFHLAHAEVVTGAGIIAAGPYYCSEDSLSIAMEQCLGKEKSNPPVNDLFTIAQNNAKQQKIADLQQLQNDNVWIFHGTQDKLVAASVTDALVSFYQKVVPEKNIIYINNLAAGHGFPTLDTGLECAITGVPSINNCKYDAAGAMLTHLYPNLKEPSATTAQVQTFDQSLYNLENASLAKTGYIYIPKACSKGEKCKLHISFHGCKNNAESIGTQFVESAGYNRWAESNNIVILYPQTTSMLIKNPYACWDWYGYTDEHFAERDGKQIRSVWNMIQALNKNKKST